MAKTRQQKEESVQKIKEKLGKAKSVVFADYRGLSMKQLSALRNELRNQNAEFTITKNTLLERAMPTTLPFGGPLPPTTYQNPTATLFAYDDEISPIKILVKALKDAALGQVKMGFMGGEALDETKIQYLASLPSKDELKSQTVGILAAPLQGMVSVLQGNLRNLVYALSEIKGNRSSFAPNGATADKEGGV